MKLSWFHLMPYRFYQRILKRSIAVCGSMCPRNSMMLRKRTGSTTSS